jgi:hypothetical protein
MPVPSTSTSWREPSLMEESDRLLRSGPGTQRVVPACPGARRHELGEPCRHVRTTQPGLASH